MCLSPNDHPNATVRLLAGGVFWGLFLASGCGKSGGGNPPADGGTGGNTNAADGSAVMGGAGGSGPVAGSGGNIVGGGGAVASGGATGTGGRGNGTGGTTPAGGSSGNAGATGTGTGGTGLPGTGGSSPPSSCVKALFGRYLLRNDGNLLYETDPPMTAQTPVLDAATGLPLPDVAGASEGYGHGCAVQGASKTAWCWRTIATGNTSGQLGNGMSDTSGILFRATQVLTASNTPLTNVAAIADGETPQNAGLDNTCAVTTEGKVYCWGNLTWIANGGTALTSAYAVPITTDGSTPLVGAVQVGLWSTMACAIVQGASAKEVWCWGQNTYGSLGLGDMVTHRYPTKVVGIANPTKVIAHDYYGTACVLDGANVRCWGETYAGQTGTGMIGASVATVLLAPTLVTLMGGSTALADVVDIHGGDNGSTANFCALTGAKTLQCWGSGLQAYPTDYGVTSVVAVGGTGALVRYVTADGMYHIGAMANHVGTLRAPNCGLLQ